jgi:hypothetical protein
MQRSAPMALIVLGLVTVLAGCGGQEALPDQARATATAAPPAVQVSTARPMTPHPRTVATRKAQPRTSAPATPAQRDHEQQFVCPAGGLEDARQLQREVDAGHQPWWTSQEMVAAACTFGTHAEVEKIGTSVFRVTDVRTGNVVTVEETQPVRTGPGGIWVVTSVARS